MRKRLCIVILLVLICISAGIRFYRLTYEDVWLDEAFDIHNALRTSLSEAVMGSIRVHHSPLDIAILFYWIRMFRDIVFGARLLYAITGTLAIIAFFWFCRIINKEGASLFPYVATLFFGLSEEVMYYSQEIRSYIFVILFSILSFGFYLNALYRKRWFDILFCISFTCLLLYSHFLAVLVLVVQNIFYIYIYLVNRRCNVSLKKWFFIQVVILLIYLPLFLKAYPTLFNKFKEGLLLSTPDLKTLMQYISFMAHPGMLTPDRWIRYVLCSFVIIFLARMLFSFIKGIKSFVLSGTGRIFIFLLLWVCIPPVILFIISRLVTPILTTRYFITCLVPLIVLSVKGYFAIHNRFINAGVLMCLLVLYGISYHNWFMVKNKERYKDVFHYVYENRFDGEETLAFFNPPYLTLPVLFNLDVDEFVRRHTDMDSCVEYLNSRNIYLYEPEKVNWLLRNKEVFDFFILENWVGAEEVKADLARRENIYKLDYTDIKPFTIVHYMIISPDDVVESGLYSNVYKEEDICYNKDYNTIYPVGYNRKGTIIYRFFADGLIGERVFLYIKGYVIFRNNYLKVYAGNDLVNLEPVYEYINKKTGQEFINRAIEISGFVKRYPEVYIKIELYVDQNTSKTPWDSRLEKIGFLLKG